MKPHPVLLSKKQYREAKAWLATHGRVSCIKMLRSFRHLSYVHSCLIVSDIQANKSYPNSYSTGFLRSPGAAGGSCGAQHYHFSGYKIIHCGHPTAHRPYYIVDPAGKSCLAPNGQAFWNLAAAKEHLFELWLARLFIGIHSCTIGYADRSVEKDGDYKRLATLHYATLELVVEPDCPQDLVVFIRADAATYQARRGKAFSISACNQTVILGSDL